MTDTRARILDAALACFVQQGVAATTVEDIRTAAGVSIGSLYHHVGDRHRLAAAVHAWLLEDYQQGFLRVVEAEGDAAAGIAAAVCYHLDWCLERPDAATYLLTEHVPAADQPGGQPIADANRAFLRHVLAWLRPHVAYGVVRDLDVDLAYALWLGPAQERCRLWLAGRAERPAEQEVRILADAAVRCLLQQPTT
jgi:AcrR family transcriptional regulator